VNKISVKQLTKSYQGKQILKKISFDVYAGNILALLGQSGGGKSTLLRCLCHLETPDSGNIELHGKKVGMVFQQLHLWKHMTVLENLITAPIHVLNYTKKSAIEKAKALLAQLKIADKMQDLPSQLSGGEQQRVAIARTLMMKPEILLFDEPTSALDSERTETVSDIIQSLAKSEIMIIVATHDQNFAKKIATRTLFLENGTLREAQ